MISVLNDVLGPVMRGPSSSHTAGSHHIARLAAGLLGARPVEATFTFDPGGSYARVYREQGVDLAFAAGLMGWPITDDRFSTALSVAPSEGLSIGFHVAGLAGADHPNTVDIRLRGEEGPHLDVRARSIGGGAVEVIRVDGWPVRVTGETHEVLVEADSGAEGRVRELMGEDGQLAAEPARTEAGGRVLLHARRLASLAPERRSAIARLPGVQWVRDTAPLAFVKRGAPLFSSAADMIRLAEERAVSLGGIALAYEAALLELPADTIMEEVARRLDIMRRAVADGLSDHVPPMQLLAPTARAVFEAEAAGRVAIGGIHTRAAARAMAVMHVNGGMGVICAAPTGGSAGSVPGVVVSLVDERGLSRDGAARALLAASAIGVVLATRATFAAEVAGCQVEIGAAGAMGAAAVVEAAGGTARQAADAAAIAFQNTMGSVCDLVQGMVEIPCHTRNAVAASSAFVCADLVLGGYMNPIPLDETIDAVYAVGRMMPSELRCTARGGLAVTPSALKLRRRR